MRILFTIVHFFSPGAKGLRPYASMSADSQGRIDALTASIAALHQHFGPGQFSLNHAHRAAFPANRSLRHAVDVVVCTAGEKHLVPALTLPAGSYQHHQTGADPAFLGYECHAVLRDRLGQYDYYCYLEDDLIIRDPMFFEKIGWFSRIAGEESLLQPNRYEVAPGGKARKVYVDGHLAERATAKFQNVQDEPELVADLFGRSITFRRTLNPHAGSFFLTQAQMAAWVARPYFLDRSASFIGPPESAATLGIMRTFKVYKPWMDNAGFLEIEHPGTSYLGLLGKQVPFAADETAPLRARAKKPAAQPAARSGLQGSIM